MNVTLRSEEDQPRYETAQYKRRTVRAKITAVTTKVEGMLQSARADSIAVDAEEINIRRLAEEVRILDEEIRSYLILPKTDEKEQERKRWEARCTEYEEKISLTLSRLNSMRLQNAKVSLNATFAAESAASPQRGSDHVRLEQMTNLVIKSEPKIPKFAGDAKKFRDWLQTYEAAVESCTTDLAKFGRLKESLVGPAYKVISCIEFNEGNYKEAIKAVKDEFGTTFTAQYAHGLEIITICNSKDFKSADKWLTTVPNLVQNVKNLKLLTENFEGAAVMILPMMLENIPISIREAFMRVHEVSNTGEAVKQLDALITFIKKENQIASTFGKSKAISNFSRPKFQNNSKQGPSSNSQQKSRENHSFYGRQEPEGDHSCIFCELKNHPSSKCKAVLTNAERVDIVQKANACTKCLRRNHVAAKCRQKAKCKKCSGAHHTMLCIRNPKPKETSTNFGNSELVTQQPESKNLERISTNFGSQANLATGYALITTDAGRELRRILLDTGSQRSFITSRLAKTLKAKVSHKDLLINHTLGGNTSEVTEFKSYSVNLISRFGDNKIFPIECLGIPVITQSIFPPAEKIKGINDYADLVPNPVHKEIDILLGAEDIGQIWLNESVSEGKLIGINTQLGWFTFGKKVPLSQFTTSLSAQQTAMLGDHEVVSVDDISERNVDKTSKDIEFMFQSETLGIEPPMENEKEKQLEIEKFENIFKKCIRRLPSGRYCLKLPFNENLAALGSNEHLAQIRLKNLIEKSSPEILAAADAEIEKYVKEGYAERAPKRKAGEFGHYLPIQIVKKPDPDSPSGFKIRLVKDAGARSKDLAALNDVLVTGQNLLPDILNVITRFRLAPIVVISDVVKAFHQFEIDKSHRTFLRFFWRPGISSNANAPLEEFWAKRLDFGLISSPWLHQAGVKFHLENEKLKRPNQLSLINEIQYSIYIDDLSLTSSNVQEAKEKVKQCKEIFEAGKFPLGKYATNSEKVAEAIREMYPGEDITVKCNETNLKFMGIRWDQATDCIGVFVDKAVQELRENKPSKRTLLSGLAKTFDPMGFISPILIQAKILLQSLWKDKLSWDDSLSEKHIAQYEDFTNQLSKADKVLVKRTNAGVDNLPIRTEIHAFSDASNVAYGAVIYAREIFKKGKPRVKFIMSKAKVTPNKGSWGIHRLELMALVISVRLVNKLKEALGVPINSITYWVDNSSVLGWTREKPSSWRTFIANRIIEVQKYSTPDQFAYVSTSSNPSDLISRGTPLNSEEILEFWTRGPKWLSETHLPKPKEIGKAVFAESIREAKKSESKISVSLATVSSSFEHSNILKCKHFSKWSKATRVIAYVLRFIESCRLKRKIHEEIHIDAPEFDKAETVLIKNLQQANFPNEVLSGCKKIQKSSKLYLYSPTVDDQGVIRCHSRLEKSGDLSFDEKFPIILDGRNYFVQLLIQWIHEKSTLHAQGISTNLHHIRTRFLILRARSSTNKVLRSCKVCVKFKAKPAAESMPPLPAFRIEEGPPFTVTGVDFCGPIKVYNELGDKVKAYIALFVCPVSRAVHLELTPSLNTFDFLLILRKFISRFPSVRKLISDNGASFKRASFELGIVYDSIRSAEIQSFLSKSQIAWEFITDRAPVQGAFYERMVQLIKKPLRKVLGTNIPKFRELESMLAEIELCINLRPISALPSKDCEIRALCPMDLVFGFHAVSRFPDSSVLNYSKVKDEDAIIITKLWRKQQSLLNGFWKRFKIEYLQQLRSAHERKPKESRPLSVGDICLLSDPSPSRSFWPICRVINVFGGERTDLRKRSCLVKIGGKRAPVKRPISMLYPLNFGENMQ